MLIHHPDENLLLDYATGSLDEPVGLLVATHLALCPTCRGQVEHYERIGGALLDEAANDTSGGDLLERVLAQLDESDMEPDAPKKAKSAPIESGIPQPLRDYLGDSVANLPWRSWPGVKEHRLLAEHEGYTTRLLSISPGKAMPQHSHEGQEFTLVLRGGFTDGDDHFLPGDVATADPSVDHKPVADSGEDCLCLAVTTGPLKLTGRYMRILNPLINI